MLTTLKRIIKAGFVNFWRSGFLSLGAIVVLTLSLTLFGGIIFASAFGHGLINQIKNRVDINVYFTLDASESDILALQQTVNQLPEVVGSTYISSTTELANFQQKWANNSLILQGLAEVGYNPLPAVLNIQAKDPSEYSGISDFLNSSAAAPKDGTTIINNINYNENQLAIDRLIELISVTEKAGSILVVILVLLAVIIVFNTIRIIIYNAKDEIGVMKLVGASNTYVRGPFVVSGIMYGIVSGIITLILLAVFAYYSDAAIIKFAGVENVNEFSGLVNVFATYFLENFGQIFSIIMGSGVVLGAVASYIAVRRYLKV